MLTPKVERLPPVTVEFLRVVRGIEAVRLQCESCDVTHVVPWADLGLSDDSLFPPGEKVWKCSLCGGTDIVATPELPVDPRRGSEAPTEAIIPPGPRAAETEDHGAISPALRERLEAVMARLGRTEE